MRVKSFTYERNWTGKYYQQRLLPSMQTMDKHIVGIPVKVNVDSGGKANGIPE